jgi:glucan phosphoethanolaminetransferase (alkaline phosphatase superfamily)
MTNKNKNQGENLFKAVIMTHIILFLHLLIIVGLVLMVIFIRGITQQILWIFLGVTGFFMLASFFIFRRIKSKGKKMFHDIDNSSLFHGRSFEVSFLRGMASLKFGQPDHDLKAINNPSSETKFQLEDPETVSIRELTELARIYEKNLITSEEYSRAKNQILKSF